MRGSTGERNFESSTVVTLERISCSRIDLKTRKGIYLPRLEEWWFVARKGMICSKNNLLRELVREKRDRNLSTREANLVVGERTTGWG